MTEREKEIVEIMRNSIREDLEGEVDDVEEATDKAMEPIHAFLEQDENGLDQYSDLPLEEVHEGVREAIEDWQDADEDGPLLYWLLKSGTPPYKMSKEESNYTDEAQDPRYSCATCEFLYTETGSGQHVCSQIRGFVEPEGWCKLWELSDAFDHVDLSELEDQNE